jgi:hypothetical protein
LRIEFKMEGGFAHFPGLSKPVRIDADQLSREESAQLEQLVQKARFFDLPGKVNVARKGAADYYQYTITIQMGKQSHTIKLVDPVEDTNLNELLLFLKKKSKETRSGRSGQR